MKCKNCGRQIRPSMFSGYEHEHDGFITCTANVAGPYTSAEKED